MPGELDALVQVAAVLEDPFLERDVVVERTVLRGGSGDMVRER